MTRFRMVFYGLLAVALVAIAVGIRLYSDSSNVHDYAGLGTEIPDRVVFSQAILAEALPHAFAFRMMPGESGTPQLVFQSGYCLLAHRVEQGTQPSLQDRLVAESVVRALREPALREFVAAEVRALRAKFPDVDDGAVADETRAALLRSFMTSIRANSHFEERLRVHLAHTAEEWGWPVTWEPSPEE